jgi:hypothetical protein
MLRYVIDVVIVLWVILIYLFIFGFIDDAHANAEQYIPAYKPVRYAQSVYWPVTVFHKAKEHEND